MLENVLLFIPFGMLFPLTFHKTVQKRNTIGAAIRISVCIEILQFVFRCGKTEIDDVILNVVGACAGLMLIWTIRSLTGKWKKHQG